MNHRVWADTHAHISVQSVCECWCVFIYRSIFGNEGILHLLSNQRGSSALYANDIHIHTHTPLSVVHISRSDLCLHTPASLQKQSTLTQISLCSYQRTLNSACGFSEITHHTPQVKLTTTLFW